MDEERQELDETELEAEVDGAQELPDREAMSVIAGLTDSIGPPPLAD